MNLNNLDNLDRVYYFGELVVGEWIILDTMDNKLHYCYVTSKNHNSFNCMLVKMLDNKGNLLKIKKREYKNLTMNGDFRIYKESSINIEEIKELYIDLALQTKDEQWFKELIR